MRTKRMEQMETCPEFDCGLGMELVSDKPYAFYAHNNALREIRFRKVYRCPSGHELVDDGRY